MTDKPSKRPHQSQDCHCPPCEKFDGPSISGPPIVVMPAPTSVPSDADLPSGPVEGASQVVFIYTPVWQRYMGQRWPKMQNEISPSLPR